MTRIHVVCSARNAGPWLGEMISSLASQTHRDWQLSMRDDGSTDDTWAVIESWQGRDPRIVRAVRGRASVGTAQAFGQLLKSLPDDAHVVSTADADDVWLPHKLERTLDVLQRQPDVDSQPILVHTDLRPVDERLREIAPSFWRHAHIATDGPTPRTVAIANIAIGPTQLFNRALLDLVRTIPPDAICQDWWITLVAAATGRIVAIDEPSMLYRRHGANDSAVRLRGRARVTQLVQTLRDGSRARRQLDEAARQAGALLRLHGPRMDPTDRRDLEGLASIVELEGISRHRAILRWRWHPRHSLAQNLGMLVRG